MAKLKALPGGYSLDGPNALSRAGFRGYDCYVFTIEMILPEQMSKKVAITHNSSLLSCSSD